MQAAAKLAELSNAKIILFRAVGLAPETPAELFNFADVPIETYLRQRARTDLERIASDTRPDLIDSIKTELATSWDGICRAARELDADLIVLGSHGYGGIDRLLGTTAAKVVNHADRNVLVVRTLV
jgi:nucleotide-binding universal stress UspA family protein